MSKTTTGPWGLERTDHPYIDGDAICIGTDESSVCTMDGTGDVSMANAALIVRAVNAHEMLRDALRNVRGLYASLVGPDDAIAQAMLSEIDAALATLEAPDAE